MSSPEYFPSSFRDPQGRVFSYEGTLCREVKNESLEFVKSFLKFLELPTSQKIRKKIIETRLEEASPSLMSEWILKHRKIDSVTYPYEWSPEQLRDAAIFTLELQKELVEQDMTLEDASPFNVLFDGALPVLVDFHSIEPRTPDTPWVAWNDFQEHFLYPLLLYANTGVYLAPNLMAKMGRLTFADTYKLLKGRHYFSWTLFKYLRLPYFFSSMSAKSSQVSQVDRTLKMTKTLLLSSLEGLLVTLRELKFPEEASHWRNYSTSCSYQKDEIETKKIFVKKVANEISDKTGSVLDIGANTGEYSFLLAPNFKSIVALESDFQSLDEIYLKSKKEKLAVVPLLGDFASLSPNLGWALTERASFSKRFPEFHLSLALAVLHHLRITTNVPLEMIMTELRSYSKKIIVEWVPLEDPMCVLLLRGRDAKIYSDYTQENFLTLLKNHYKITAQQELGNGRVLYFAEA